MDTSTSQQAPSNLALNHVALSVHDIEVVTAWYTSILGFRLACPVMHITRKEDPNNSIFRVYGPDLHEVKVALLLAGNKVGFEIFEFVQPRHEPQAAPFEYHRQGVFHICITDVDVEARVEKIVEAGGELQGEILNADPARNITAAYVKDPWGNMLEVLSVGFDVLTGM